MADNPTSKFKFVSPGVFVDEIDNSQLPATPEAIGPLVIGRARKGPSMEPIVVNSYSDFVDTFGNPVAGPEGGDVWREGVPPGATYGALAAQAWLRNNAPLTYVRLVGKQDSAATTAGYAGWKAGTISSTPSEGGAWGLFVWPSGVLGKNTDASSGVVTGSLAAIFYLTAGRLLLSGTTNAGVTSANMFSASAGGLYESDSNGNLTLVYVSGAGQAAYGAPTAVISLDPNNKRFIRNVLNTNPTLTNTAITKGSTATGSLGGKFWVGETYERHLVASSSDGSSFGVLSANVVNTKFHAAILAMRNRQDTSDVGNDFQQAAQKGTTGWFVSQDMGAYAQSQPQNNQKLFRFEALTAGDWVQTSVKISISNIKAPQGDFVKYGSFSVVVRKISDTDNVPVIIERWDNLNLDPVSENFIAKRIGDKYQTFDTTLKGNRTYGQYENRSKYIRVVMDEDVEAGITNAAFVPFGVFGPLKYRNCTLISGSDPCAFNYTTGPADTITYVSGTTKVATILEGGPIGTFGNPGGYAGDSSTDHTPGMMQAAPSCGDQVTGAYTASVVFPSMPLRGLSNWGEPKSLKQTYWGVWTGKTNTDPSYNESIVDCLRPRLKNVNPTNPASTAHDIAVQNYSPALALSSSRSGSDALEIAWLFTLDDISGSTAEGFRYMSGSRQAGTSISAVSSSYTGTLEAGHDKFTTVLFGGSDGFDVTEKDPFRDSISGFTSATNPKASYELATLRQAVDIVSDAEVVPYNIVTMPGIMQHNVTKYLLDTVEDRGDALAIIDIRKVYDAETENTSSSAERNAYTIRQAVDNLKDRNLDSSYGCVYAPWVRIQEPTSGRTLWAPPSIVALGALSTVDRNSYPWYAPAGFSRGGLSDGDGGLPVLDVSKRLTSDDRDDLYEANINPIAKFPAEGIVIFGQKTLQQTASALDRINVRRLMIYLKRQLSFIASRMLFEPNNRDTWNNFVRQTMPVLDTVKAQYGIDEFRLILDETTTTPDLIDRNIIYAKLLVKPTRAVEFFAIDFVVTNSGASFAD